jgi:crotonobetainyl-CoA:carnitine CoA-transferase CaiB-like acyl-CoA transferase
MRAGVAMADLCAGLFCAMGILTALLERHTSGKGQWVQTSLLQAQVFMLDFQAARFLMDGKIPQQAGNNHPTSIPTGVFATRDSHINIAVAGEVIWQRFCTVMDRQIWAQDERFSSSAKRSENRDTLNREIADLIVENTSEYWVERLSKAGIPAGPIHDMAGVFSDPQVEHLGLAKEISTTAFGDTKMLAQPLQLSRTPCDFVTGPPERGEQTDEILAELGISQDQIDDFRHRNII